METTRTIVRRVLPPQCISIKTQNRVIPLRSIHCDVLGQLFLLAMSGHAGPIQIAFGVTPVAYRISLCQAAALSKGGRACRADLNVSSRASDGKHGQPKRGDGYGQGDLCRGVCEYLRGDVSL